MRTKTPILLLLLCACAELTPKVRTPDISDLSKQISRSKEFREVLSWTKTLFKPGAVEAMIANMKGDGDLFFERKVELSQKGQLTEAEAAELYGFSNFKTLKHVSNNLELSLKNLHLAFPALKNLNPETYEKVMNQSLKEFQIEHPNSRSKLSALRTASCIDNLGTCIDNAMNSYLFSEAVCVGIGIVGGAIGFVMFNPAVIYGAVAVMGACYVTYQIQATRAVGACNATYYTCKDSNVNVSAFYNDESIIFEEEGWNSVPSYVVWNEQCMCWQQT